jgi:hypothetical protein
MTAPWAYQPRPRPVHGVTVGILILDTGFQRFPGDIGNAGTFSFPVQYAVVRGATPKRVLGPDVGELLDDFLRAADDLIALGVDGITTSCGFLAALHPQFVAHCPVPVATSSLMQIPLVQATLPRGKRVGVLTADKSALTAAHFAGVGAPQDLPVAGLPLDGIFKSNSRRNAPVINYADNEREVLAIAQELLDANPDIGAIVSECTNFAPYSAEIANRFGLPVYDIITLVEWFHAGLRPRLHHAAPPR